jgi:hypothetical protein
LEKVTLDTVAKVQYMIVHRPQRTHGVEPFESRRLLKHDVRLRLILENVEFPHVVVESASEIVNDLPEHRAPCSRQWASKPRYRECHPVT